MSETFEVVSQKYEVKSLFDEAAIPSDHLIVQHNNLSVAKHDLTLLEMRILLEAIKNIAPEDDDLKDYQIDVDSFIEMLETKNKNETSRVRKICYNILTKPTEIPQEDGSYLYCNWFSYLKYDPKVRIIKYSFDRNLKPYLLQLKKNFTKYDSRVLYKIKSVYALRLYMILKTEAWKGQRREYIISIDKLKEILKIEEKYTQYGHLKTKVLDIAEKYINETTSMHVSIEPIKKDRKIEAVKFIITKRDILELKDFEELSFREWKDEIVKIFKGKDLCVDAPGFMEDTVISISKAGYLFNQTAMKDLIPEDAVRVWNWLFEHKERVGNVRFEMIKKARDFIGSNIRLLVQGKTDKKQTEQIVTISNIEPAEDDNHFIVSFVGKNFEGKIPESITRERIKTLLI